jgi:hypothetical protein
MLMLGNAADCSLGIAQEQGSVAPAGAWPLRPAVRAPLDAAHYVLVLTATLSQPHAAVRQRRAEQPPVQRSTDTVHAVLVLRYRWNRALWGIGLLNEPVCTTGELTDYYDRAYKAIRSVNLWAYVVVSPLVYKQVSRYQPFMFGFFG